MNKCDVLEEENTPPGALHTWASRTACSTLALSSALWWPNAVFGWNKPAPAVKLGILGKSEETRVLHPYSKYQTPAVQAAAHLTPAQVAHKVASALEQLQLQSPDLYTLGV